VVSPSSHGVSTLMAAEHASPVMFFVSQPQDQSYVTGLFTEIKRKLSSTVRSTYLIHG